MTALEITIDQKRYRAVDRAEGVPVLQGLRLSVGASQLVCLLGPSGCGKTTLLHCIAGLDRDFAGSISVAPPPGEKQARIGYVFQTPRLLPWRTVRQNIELVLTRSQRDDPMVEELLQIAGLSDLAEAYPERLSLGQERRVALVRAFVVKPDLLLMDEPFVSLDEPTARRLRSLLVTVWQRRPTTVLFVTHDLREAIELADRIILLSASPASVLSEIQVALPRDQRGNEEASGKFLAELRREQPDLAALL